MTTPNAPSGHVIGIDLGGTHVQAGVVDDEGRIIGRARGDTGADRGAAHVLGVIASLARDACRQGGIAPADTIALGIGAPGVIDAPTGIVVEAPNLRWTRFPLRQELLRQTNAPRVIVENDVNAAIVGEWAYGAARGADDVLGVWVGTGVGGGLILGGKLRRGATGSGGEIGQTLLLPGAVIGQRRLEETCSRAAIERRLATLIRTNYPTSLRDALPAGATPDDIDAGMIARAYQQEDPLVRAVVDEAADLLGVGIANVVTVLGLELVVLGGGLAEVMGGAMWRRVQSRVRDAAFPSANESIRVIPTQLEDDAGLLGAAWCARAACADA